MGFQILYKPLFNVEILHEYYLNKGSTLFDNLNDEQKDKILGRYDILADMEIFPSHDTQLAMRNLGLLLTKTKTGFSVLIRVNPTPNASGGYTPFFPLDEEMALNFAVQIKNPFFLNFSSLRLASKRYRIYYFSNRVNNSKDGIHYLSLPVGNWTGAIAYESGDVVRTSPTELFEAIKNVPPGTATSDTTAWRALTQNFEYVTFADHSRLYPQLFEIDLPSNITKATMKIARAGESTPFYTQTVEGEPSLPTFPADLRTLDPGKYDLKLEDQDNNTISSDVSGLFYLDQTLYQGRTFGITQVFHKPGTDLGNYNLLDLTTGELKSPLYTLRFINRSTFWRYIYVKDPNYNDLGELEDEGTVNGKKQLKTNAPKPLTFETEEITVTNSNGDDIKLPNPSVNLIKPDQSDDKVYSEIFVHT